jgi:hypothetical protein
VCGVDLTYTPQPFTAVHYPSANCGFRAPSSDLMMFPYLLAWRWLSRKKKSGDFADRTGRLQNNLLYQMAAAIFETLH